MDPSKLVPPAGFADKPNVVEWFRAVSTTLLLLDSRAFAGVDLTAAEQEFADLATLVTQQDPPRRTTRNTRGGSGQSDGN